MKGVFLMNKKHIYKIVFTGVLIGISVVLSLFNPMIPLHGIPGMRITFSAYTSVIPSFLFGPVYGGIAMGITDILSFLVKPEGTYMIHFTVTAVLKGVMLGCLWWLVKKSNPNQKKYGYFKVMICLLPVNILITTINTKLIMMLYSIDKAFIVYYIPRLIEEVINIIIQSYVVSYLLKIYQERINK